MNKQIEDEGLHLAYELGKADGIKQGRADAIEEFRKFSYCKVCEEKGWDIYCDYCRVCQSQEYIAEQLKEKKDMSIIEELKPQPCQAYIPETEESKKWHLVSEALSKQGVSGEEGTMRTAEILGLKPYCDEEKNDERNN